MIIDYIDKLETENIDNLHSLGYMKEGLNILANNMSDYENQTRNMPEMKGCVLSLGSPVGISMNTLVCIYMWFSNTLVNYVQLIGTLSIMKEKGWKFIMYPQFQTTS